MRPQWWKAAVAALFATVIIYGIYRFFTGFSDHAGIAGPVEIRVDPGLRAEELAGARKDALEPGSQPRSLTPLWSMRNEEPCHLALAGRLLLAASASGSVTALEAEKGIPLWRYDAGGRIASSPECAEGKVFFGTSNGIIHALDAASGLVLWTFNAGGEPISAPVVQNGRVFFIVDSGFNSIVFCLEAASGRRVWSCPTREWVAMMPACGRKTLHFGTYGRKAVALNIVNGKQAWEAEVGRTVFASPVVNGNFAYYAGIDGRVLAMTADEGTVQWEQQLQEFVWMSPLQVGNRLFFATYERNIIALDSQYSHILWKTSLGEPVEFPLQAGEGAIYAFTASGRLYRLDSASGNRQGTWRLEGAPWTAPLLGGGKIFASTRDGYLRAYREPPPAANEGPASKEHG